PLSLCVLIFHSPILNLPARNPCSGSQQCRGKPSSGAVPRGKSTLDATVKTQCFLRAGCCTMKPPENMAARTSSPVDEFSLSEIQREVEAVTSSAVLSNSHQLCRFLRYLVDRTLAGDSASLKESLLGTEVFNRGIRYDPRTDPVVRIEARRL